MSDLIRRQDAIDFINAGHLVNPNEPRWSDNEVVNFLKSRPSAQSEPRWIPCSEMMPEIGREVLVYAVGKDDGFIGDSVIALSERFIFRLFPSSEGVEEWRSPWVYFDSNYEITHWMPLPKPPTKI